ncbi:FHA domain-containing protein, partial [Myxococcus sp. 1LA]
MPILLTITQGLQTGRELTFEAAEVNIGRTSENDLVLHDHGVSRRHARIVLRDDKYFVADMGSSNGTVLNGGLLSGEQQLRDGDKIGVGPVEFTFVWVPPEGDEDATRPIRRGDPVPTVDPDATRPIRLNDPIPAASGIVLPEGFPTAQQPAVAPVRPGTSAAVAKA